MKRIAIAILAATGITWGMAGASAWAGSDVFTIKIGTLAPKGSPWYRFIRDMASEWEASTEGGIKVRIYPGGVIGDERDMVRKMAIGQLHGAVLTAEGLAEIVPHIKVFQLPLLLSSNAELDHVLDQMAPELEEDFLARGYRVISWGDVGWVHIFARQPVVYPKDLMRQKLFSWAGDTTAYNAYREAGFQPVPLQVSDLHTALLSGLVDAFSTTPVAALSFQWFGSAPHMTDLKWAPLIGATVLTKSAWEKIPAEARDMVLESGRRSGTESRDAVRAFETEAITVMKQHGLRVHAVPADVLGEWELRARAAYGTFMAGDVSPELLSRVEQVRDEYRYVASGG